MSTTKHTPGDWKVERVAVGGTPYQGPERTELWITVGEYIIATIDPATGECPPEYEANADLIIAAPTLQSRIDCLEAEKAEITAERDMLKRQIEVNAIVEDDTIAERDRLKAEKRELVDILKRFVNWDIRLSEPVTEGIDRDIIKDAQAALSKHTPSEQGGETTKSKPVEGGNQNESTLGSR